MDTTQLTGHLILLMAPSGSGKRLLVEGLGAIADSLYFAKTYTSRKPREGAIENPKYQFVAKEVFEEMIEKGAFIEWAEFSGNLYGTPVSEFVEPLQTGKVVFKEMELQGIQQIKKLIPEENITVVYIEAGGWDELKRRILERAPISEEELQLRYERYVEESKAKGIANVVIHNTNGQLQQAQKDFAVLIQSILQKVEA